MEMDSKPMENEMTFWAVDSADGEPDLWVCMTCLNEVYRQKVPIPDCPTCHGVSTYEAFTLDSIRDWGTEDLIAKAAATMGDVNSSSQTTTSPPHVEPAS